MSLLFQGEKYCFLGCVAPTITVLRRKLVQMIHLIYCNPLKLALIKALEERFYYVFDLDCEKSKWFVLSAMSHPKFKMSWIPERYHETVKNLFIAECIDTKSADYGNTSVESNCSTHAMDDNDSFYDSILDTRNISCKEISSQNITNCEVLTSDRHNRMILVIERYK